MNLPTILISLFLVVLFALAIRSLAKKGTCAGCSENVSCRSDGSDNRNGECNYCNHRQVKG